MNPTFPSGTWIWVAAGGAVGSVLRYGVAELVRRAPSLAGYPWATLGVNVTGALALGAVAGWLFGQPAAASPQLRAFVMIGVLGGYTTFSTFAVEGLTMLQAGQPMRAAGYALASVLLSVAAAALGWAMLRGAA
ncbi:MAG: fluoride efflux transporter CrcB [Gemmatimonadaceae bacterium]|nr:fluoride efflux transporter CrcB [Gemmatimonadaceae bacterium]